MRAVAYVVTSRSKGTGGHLHSLRDLTDALSGAVRGTIRCIGTAPPPALNGAVMPVSFTAYRPRHLVRILVELARDLRRQRVELVHAFDPLALKLVLPVADALGLPTVFTMCGGPTPRRDMPNVRDVILFSRENLDGLSTHPAMRDTRLRLVPNRVHAVPVDARLGSARGRALRAHLGLADDALVLLRINRMSTVYAPVMEQTMALAAALRTRGVPMHAVLVGSPNDPALVEALRARTGPFTHLVTAPEFTHRAAELTPSADAVVGTGRGLMEAASAGRPLLTPIADRRFPAVLGPSNFDTLHDTNFSPRNRLAVSDDALVETAVETLATAEGRARAGAFAREMFDTRFDVHAAVGPYLETYAQAPPRSLLDLPSDLARLGIGVGWERVRVLLGALPKGGTAD